MMIFQRLLIVVLSIMVFSSCAHAPKKRVVKEMTASVSVTGTVVNAKALIQGGAVGLTAFRAGAQAEATEELDHISMMIIKGVKESLDRQKTSLHVISANEGQPQIALEGYIQEYSKTGTLSRMMMHPNKITLSLTGEVWLIGTGERLLNFSAKKTFNPKESAEDIAFALGRGIGDFIAKQAQNCQDSCEDK